MSGDIEFSEEVSTMLFVLLGERPLQADSDLAYGSRLPFQDYGDRLRDLSDKIRDSLSSVQGALPPQVAEQYIQAMGMLTGTNGVDHFGEFVKQLEDLADGQIEQSRKIMESKWEIIAEIVQLLIELAFIAAMAFFTGGLSFGEAALAKARTRFSVLLILDRLLRSTNLLPAFSEALQEAFTTFAVRLAMLSLNTGDRRPDGIDWGDIGKSAAFGAVAGFFIGGLGGAFNNFFKKYFNDFGDNKWGRGFGEVGQDFLAEGFGETGAEYLVNGLYTGNFEWKWDTFLGAGLSSISEFVIFGGVGAGALFLNNKFFGPHDFDEYNELPGHGGDGGPGSAGGPTPLPLPRPDVVSGGAGYANSGPNSLPTPPPPPAPLLPQPLQQGPNDVGLGFGPSTPAASFPLSSNPLPLPAPNGVTGTTGNGAAGSSLLPDPGDNSPLPSYDPGAIPTGASGRSSVPPPLNGSIPPLSPGGSAGSTGSATDIGTGSSPVLPGPVTPSGLPPLPGGITLPTPLPISTTSPYESSPNLIDSSSPIPDVDGLTQPDLLNPLTQPDPLPLPPPLSPSLAASPVGSQTPSFGPAQTTPPPITSPTPSPSTAPESSTAPNSTARDEQSHSPEDYALPPTTTPHQTVSPAGGTGTPGTSLPASTPGGSSTSSPDGSSAGQPVPEELPDETPQDIDAHAPERSGGPTTPAHTSADPARPRTESGPESVQESNSSSTSPSTTRAPHTNNLPDPASAITTGPEVTGPAVDHDTSISDPRSQPVMVDPVADPVRPEQWRPRREDATASPLWTERYDPAADPLGPDRTPQTLAGHDTVIRTWIRRIEADDGRWVRNLTLELPVRFGDGFHADQLPEFENHMRGLLDAHFNHGLTLPRSGDQLHIDVNLVHAPDHPEAIELSATDKPTDSDQFHFRMYSDDPTLAPPESDRRRRRNDATALHELMHYTGLKDRMHDDSSLFRRIAGGQVHPTGIMADLDTLPGPAVPLDYVQTIEDVIDSGPVVRDHPRSAPAPVATTSADPASLLPPTDRFPAHPPSQGKTSDSDSDSDGGLFSVPLRQQRNVPPNPSEDSDSDSDSDDGLFAVGLRQGPGVAPRPAGEVAPEPQNTEAAGPSVSADVTFADSVPPPGSRSLRLSEVMPEKDWWQLFIDPRDHERALKYHPEDPGGIYEREQSPGFRQGMVDAYREAMDSSHGVGHRMNSGLYLRLHSLVINYLDKKPGWSGGEPTSFPLRNADLSEDVLQETLGGRQLVLDLSTYDWSGPEKASPITALDRFSKPGQALLQTNYKPGEATALVDQAFDRYYDEAARSTNDLGKLSAIARAVRALQIIHPFHDANRRVNVHLLLHKLLLEQGFSPVVTTDLAKLFQGSYSVPQMAETLAQHTRPLTTPLPPPPTSSQTTTDPAPSSSTPTLSTSPPNHAQRSALVEDLRSRLPGMSADGRASELALLSADELESLAADPTLVDALRAALPPSEFAATAAQLMVRIPDGVDQPVSARREVQAWVARMLGDPNVAARLLNDGSRVLVVPKAEALTSLDPFRHLAQQKIAGADGRLWDTVRGGGDKLAAVSEENLLGEFTGVPGGETYADGYSTTTHEFAHTIHLYGLTDADRQTIAAAYQEKVDEGPDAEWPDGPLYDTESRPTANYSSTNEFEYFAQVTNAYLGTNAGTDPYTGRPRNNTTTWVRQHAPALVPILERLYGTDPQKVPVAQANPVERTQAENDLYDGYRAFWDQAENTYRPQPHVLVPVAPQIHSGPASQAAQSDVAPLPPPPRPGEGHSRARTAAPAVPVHPADLVRLRYQHEAEAYERRLGDYLSEHPEVVEQVARFARIVWEKTPPAMRGMLGTYQNVVPGAVGTDPEALEQVAYHGNFREQSTLLWNALRYNVFGMLLGKAVTQPQAITEERRWRGDPSDGPFSRRAPHELRPPLSSAERAFSSDGATWKPGEEQSGIDHRPPSPMTGDARPFTLEDSPHAAAQRTGGLILTGTSGTAYNLLDAAEAANERWDAGLDLRWMRLATVGAMLSNRHHTLHELLASAELWGNEATHPDRHDLGFDYDDNWGRYTRLSPLSEQELREHVAVGRRFPDERVQEFYADAGSGATPVSAAPPLSQLLPEDSWWRLFIDPNVHADAFRTTPEDVGGHLDAKAYPGYRASMSEAYREILDGGRIGRDWSRIDADAYEELHNMATRYLVPDAGQNTATTWSGHESGRTTMRGTGADRVAPDIKDDLLRGRRLLFPIDEPWQRGMPKPLVVFHHGQHGGQVSIDYTPGETREVVQAALDRYYDEAAVAAGPDAKLTAIARVIRALQVLQPFTDANSRVNVHLLMQKFLLEQGFRPAVLMDSRSLFLGGFTVDEIVGRLKEGMERFDRQVRDARWDGFNQPPGPDTALVDQLAADLGLTGGTPEERRPQVTDTVRTARALLGSELPGSGEQDTARLAAIRSLTGPAQARFPHTAAPLAITQYTREVFGLASVDEVSRDHIGGLVDAAVQASALGRPLEIDVLRSLTQPPPADELGPDAASDPSRSVSPGAEPAFDALAYEPPSDGLKPLVFTVSELTGNTPVHDADDLGTPLLPAVQGEPMGSVRFVLRAAAQSFAADPIETVSELADSMGAPVDLLLADPDGTVRLLRFDDGGSHDDLGPVPQANAPKGATTSGREPAFDALAYEPPSDGLKPLVYTVSELTGNTPVHDADDLGTALLPAVQGEPLGSVRFVLRATPLSFSSDPVETVSELADSMGAPVDLLLADPDGTVRLLRFDDGGSHDDLGPVPQANAPKGATTPGGGRLAAPLPPPPGPGEGPSRAPASPAGAAVPAADLEPMRDQRDQELTQQSAGPDTGPFAGDPRRFSENAVGNASIGHVGEGPLEDLSARPQSALTSLDGVSTEARWVGDPDPLAQAPTVSTAAAPGGTLAPLPGTFPFGDLGLLESTLPGSDPSPASPDPRPLPPVDEVATRTTASPQPEAPSTATDSAVNPTGPAAGSALSAFVQSSEPAPKKTEPAPKKPEPAQKPIERQLEVRRPPRIDRELPPPAQRPSTVTYSDKSRMPAIHDSLDSLIQDLPAEVASRSTVFGLKDFTLRGTDQALSEIARQLDAAPALRPKPPGRKAPAGTGLLADVATALSDDLDGLVGDGRDFAYTDTKGRQRVLKLRLRPYGQWEKFSDVAGGPSALGKVWQTAVTTGKTPRVSSSRMINPLVPLFPASQPVHVFARLGLRFGQGRSLGYSLTSQATAQVESKASQASHVHLDDVYYDITVTDADGNPVTEDGSANGRPGVASFALRSGLTLRLPDNATAENKPGRIPRTLEFRSQPDLRLVGTESYGPLAQIKDWAAAQIGAKPGSSAYSDLDTFFSARNFQRLAPFMATGRITTPTLYGDGKNARPLGFFTVRSTSQRALLLTDSVIHALGNQAQLTKADSRALTKSNTQEISPSLGPALQWMGLDDARLNLRVLIALVGRFGHTSSRISNTGGSGSVQAVGGTADKAVTGLYLVQKSVSVQRTGRDRDAPAQQNGEKPQYAVQEFTTWSLERISGSEARRLADWDDGTSLRNRKGLPAPFPPPYLTLDKPPTLGASRVEQFTFADGQFTHDGPDGQGSRTLLDHFTDLVLTEASRAYPHLIAPFSELDPANPRWRNADHFQLALSNALEVARTLAHTSMAENLESLITTGLRIELREHGRLHRGYRYLWLDGELKGRRYEGTDSTRKFGFNAVGTERLDSELSVSHGAEVGLQSLITLRGTRTDEIGVSTHAGTLTLGGTGGGQWDESSAFGPSVTRDIGMETTTPPHLFSYELSVTASRGGYWRLPGLMRGAFSAGLLGTGLFVFRENHRALFGGAGTGAQAAGGPANGAGTADGALTGRVLLSVPAEHSSEADPDDPDAENPYHDLTDTVRDQPMHDTDAFQLATGSPEQMEAAARRDPAPYEKHPFQTLMVVARPELIAAAEAVLKKASGGSWHQTQQGAPGHDAALTVFQAPYLTANSDQTMAPTGYRVSGLWAPGPYLNRSGALAHRMVLRGLRILAGPAPIGLSHSLTSGSQTAGRNTKSLTYSFGGSLVVANTHAVGRGGVHGIGPTLMPFTYSRAISQSLTLSASSEFSRSDASRKVLVSGNADHEVAAASTALGTMSAANSSLVPRSLGGAAGRRVLVPGGWIGHLPEKSAVELDLIQDGFGPVPRYANHVWAPQSRLPTGHFGSYPVNALNTAAVLAEFDRQLGKLFTRESDRDTVRRLVSGRVARAMRGEMSGAGVSVAARTGRWGWDILRVGGRQVRVRAELLPGTSRFVGLDHSAEFKDTLSATESKTSSVGRTRGPQFGLSVSQSVPTENPAAPFAGPSYSETGSSLVTRSAARGESSREAWSVKLTDPYAEHVTPYRLRLTLEVEGVDYGHEDANGDGNEAANGDGAADGTPPPRSGRGPREPIAAAFRGKRRVVQEDAVGELRTHTSLSLTLPAQPDSTLLDTPFAPPAPGPVRLASLPAFTGDANWRAVTHPDGSVKPFVLPEGGFVIREVIGSSQVEEAARRSLAKAYDIRFRDTGTAGTAPKWSGDTPLTRIGTGSAYNLEEGTTGTVLSTFAGKALGDGGYALPGLTEDSVVGGADGRLTVYCKPHLDRARLLTVADGTKMEHSSRDTNDDGRSVGSAESGSSTLGAAPAVPAAPAGSVAPGATVPAPNASGSDSLPGGLSGVEQIRLEIKGRAFLFSVPASWLTVASVHRHFKDGRVGRALISPLQALAPAHVGNAGAQAYETDAPVLAWVAEDVARELGLIDDTNFPERVGKAWDAVKTVSQAWVDADKAYWLARREAGTDPHDAVTSAQPVFDAARAERDLAQAEFDAAHQPLVDATTHADALRNRATALREDVETALREAQEVAALIAAEAAQEEAAQSPDGRTAGFAPYGPASLEALTNLDEVRERFDRDQERADQLDADAARMVAQARQDTAQRRTDADERLERARTEFATARRELDQARTVFERHQRGLAELLATAEELAGNYHEVRSAADRLTRWHVLNATAEGRDQLGDLAEPPEVTFTEPNAEPKAPTYEKETGEDGTTTLTSPDGERFTLLGVPADGESFFHALAEGLRRGDPGSAVSDMVGPPAAMRTEFALRLRDPENAILLDSLAPDERDTFSADELAQASVDLGADTPEQREFDAIGVVPHTTDLSPGSRLELATAQLLRSGGAPDDAGWDHGAADLLPALAARTFGVPVTVVDSEGLFQTFWPATETGAKPVVLYLADKHFQAAVRGRPAPGDGATPSSRQTPSAAPAGPVRPAHAKPPWQNPSDAKDTPRFDAASDHLGLTGPDGTFYDLIEAQGDGNRFYTALAAALPAGRAAPGRPRPSTADSIATAVAASALPSNARLDQGAVFRSGDPGVADAGLDDATLTALHEHGGTLPSDIELDERQTAALIRSQLRTGRRWDPQTAALAAESAAGALGVRVTLVQEDGSFESHPAATAADDLVEVLLYRRGDTYLTVRPRAAAPTAPAPVPSQAVPNPATSVPPPPAEHPASIPPTTLTRQEQDPSPRNEQDTAREGNPPPSRPRQDSASTPSEPMTQSAAPQRALPPDPDTRPHELAEVAGPGDRFTEALTYALWHNAPQIFDSGSELASAIGSEGMAAEASTALRRWVSAQVTVNDVPADVALPDPRTKVSSRDMDAAGVQLSMVQRTQMALMGGSLSAADAGLDRADAFRLLLNGSGGSSEAVRSVLATLVAEELGIRLAVVRRGSDGTESIQYFGPPRGVPILLSSMDDGPYFAALWLPPPPPPKP